jgi:exportin-1
MNSQFTNIFNLCELVLNNVEQLKPPLIKACLDTLHSFLSWIPAIYIYFSDIINKLTLFLSNDYLRLSSLNCLI